MNMTNDIYARCRSGVVHLIFFDGRERISSGTGFMLGRKLVTNSHVCRIADVSEVLIRTMYHDQEDITDGFSMGYRQFCDCIIGESTENEFDYAILDIPSLANADLFNFSIEQIIPPSIGREYVFLGYPLDSYKLAINKGSISSIKKKIGVNIIQLNASVNNGNSGGPLVELTDGGLIGIVTRKISGLTKKFDELYTVFDGEISSLESSNADVDGDTNDVNSLKVSLSMLRYIKHLCKEIERSANSGVGHAFSIEHLVDKHGALLFS